MGNSLTVDVLLEAYGKGLFPMGMEDGSVRWFSPDPRGIIPLSSFHTPHGLKRVLRRPGWEIRINTCFSEVMQCCGAREETWITGEILRAFGQLHGMGYAHSVEVWKQGRLVGGLYGVALGAAFFGESMFHRETDASKVALWHLVDILKAGGFLLLDTQWTTDHLSQFGAVEIPRPHYLDLLDQALRIRGRFPSPGPMCAPRPDCSVLPSSPESAI